MPPSALVLASTSVYRRELLSRLRLPFSTAAPGVDEAPILHQTPLEHAQRLALAKATAVAQTLPQATVIGSDQVAVCKGELLGKPGDAEHCREQLRWLSAAAATFYTAVAVLQLERGQTLQFVDTTTVYFRALSEPEIERYIAAEQPFDCAGGFRCEGLGIALFARVVSEDSTALIGLPLIAVARALRQLGYEVP
jgi:septum formation protein